ncbi:MAG: phosphatidylglycerol lysyltransferase domain-containing protein [Candidatus Omnitrophota bacterium]|jgi:hypothetical protein
MVIPAYPDFKPLELEYLSIFNQAFKENPPRISEFTFTNLYAWREAYKFKVSTLDNFIILSSEKDAQMRFFDPIGSGDKKKAMERISDDFKAIFIRIPEETAALFSEDARFGLKPDIDNSDYLYKTDDLIKLKGSKFDGKRNLLKNFRLNNAYEYAALNAQNSGECLKFIDTWCTIKNCDRVEGLGNEKRAIGEMLAHYSDFGLIGGAIRIQGNINALALAQELNPDTLVMHVLKADPDVSGLYQAILQEFLTHQAGNSNYVNLQQDLGITGLRKAKQSYHPVEMIKKYTLTRAG